LAVDKQSALGVTFTDVPGNTALGKLVLYNAESGEKLATITDVKVIWVWTM